MERQEYRIKLALRKSPFVGYIIYVIYSNIYIRSTAMKRKRQRMQLATINGIFKWHALHQVLVSGSLKVPFIFGRSIYIYVCHAIVLVLGDI